MYSVEEGQPVEFLLNDVQTSRGEQGMTRCGLCSLIVAFLMDAVLSNPAQAQVNRFYGDPVELKSGFIYFTS